MEMTRRLVLVGIMVLVYCGSVIQLVSGTIFSAVYMLFQMQVSPYTLLLILHLTIIWAAALLPPLFCPGGCCLGGCCHRRCLLLCFNLFLEGTLEPLLVKVDFVLHSKLALEMIPDAFASDALQLARREELRDAEAHLVLV